MKFLVFHYDCSKSLWNDTNDLPETSSLPSKISKNTQFHDHGLSPLPMQIPYSKFILAIKTLSVNRLSKFLQVLLGQTKNTLLTWKYLSYHPLHKNVLRKTIISGKFLDLSILTNKGPESNFWEPQNAILFALCACIE